MTTAWGCGMGRAYLSADGSEWRAAEPQRRGREHGSQEL
jgi:hypothetical protein